MASSDWLILQLIFSTTVILINIILFHFLNARVPSSSNNGFSTPITSEMFTVKKFGTSLSFLNVLSGSCLLVTSIVTLITYHISGYYPYMGLAETFILAMTIISTMFHLLSIMVNDFKIACRGDVLPEENHFYIALTWISTIVCSFLLFFVHLEHEITQIFSCIFLATDVFLLACYLDITRRTFLNRRADLCDRFLNRLSSDTICRVHAHLFGGLTSHFHRLFLGVLLVTSFIVFTVPFSLERLIWHQNHLVSFVCVTLNSISQAAILSIRMYMK